MPAPYLRPAAESHRAETTRDCQPEEALRFREKPDAACASRPIHAYPYIARGRGLHGRLSQFLQGGELQGPGVERPFRLVGRAGPWTVAC